MDRNTTFHSMVWHPHKNGHLADGQWQATEARSLHPLSALTRYMPALLAWDMRMHAAAPACMPGLLLCLHCSNGQEGTARDRILCHLVLQELIYPQLYRYILHPCVSWPGLPNMCGGLHTATGCLRFDSFLTQRNVVIMLIYEVWGCSSGMFPGQCMPPLLPNIPVGTARTCCSESCPAELLSPQPHVTLAQQGFAGLTCSALCAPQVFPKCGDGVNFVVTLTPVDGSEVQVLHEVRFLVLVASHMSLLC